MAAGFVVPGLPAGGVRAERNALQDLYDATIAYNVRYSGETYRGPLQAVLYLLTFPVAARAGGFTVAAGGAAARCCSPVSLATANGWSRSGIGRRGVPVDRDQRQPRTATVFRPGAAAAGPRGSMGRERCCGRVDRAINSSRSP